MGRRVYLETSVSSDLAALPSRDGVVAGRQRARSTHPILGEMRTRPSVASRVAAEGSS
jgi:hypothetical protein